MMKAHRAGPADAGNRFRKLDVGWIHGADEDPIRMMVEDGADVKKDQVIRKGAAQIASSGLLVSKR